MPKSMLNGIDPPRIYFHPLSFLNMEMAQVVDIRPDGRQELIYPV